MTAAEVEAFGPRLRPTYEMAKLPGDDDGSAKRPALENEDPSHSGRGPARALAALYERLLADASESPHVVGRLLEPSTARALCRATYPDTKDVIQNMTLNVGMAMYVHPKFAGPFASTTTFGHGGSRSSFGFADPDRRLAVAAIFVGRPNSDDHYDRCRRVSAALYRDLGFAPA